MTLIRSKSSPPRIRCDASVRRTETEISNTPVKIPIGHVQIFSGLQKYVLLEEPHPHCEAFAAVHSNLFRVREKVCHELRWLKKFQSNPNGLNFFGFSEIAMSSCLESLGVSTQKPQLVVRLLNAFIGGQWPSDQHLYLSYTYIPHDLKSYVQVHKPGSTMVHKLVQQLLAGLDFIHGRGVVHRNLKCATVLVYPDGQLVLAGLCTARLACPIYEPLPVDGDRLCTTVNVRAPELLLGPWKYGPPQDIWAAGMLLAVMCGCQGFEQAGHCTTDMQVLRTLLGEPEDDTLKTIFNRLGTPTAQHPLTQLDGWSVWRGKFPHFERQRRGWTDAETLLGMYGMKLLDALTDLDLRLRPTAAEALNCPYFQHLPPAHEMDSCPGEETPKSNVPVSTLGPKPAHRRRMPKKIRERMKRDAIRVAATEPHFASDAWHCTRNRAAKHYMAWDLATGRASELQRLVIAKALDDGFLKIGRPSSTLRNLIWSFIQRPHHPAVDGWAHAININTKMRAILIDWLIEVAVKYRTPDPVIHYTVGLIDAYVAQHPSLARRRLQLLGVAALLVADKVVGHAQLSNADMIYICDSAYREEQLITFEPDMLPIIDKVSQGWGACHFLAHLAAELELPKKLFHVAQMYLEGSLLHFELTRYTPCVLAAGACLLAVRIALALPGRFDVSKHMISENSCDELAVCCGRSKELLNAVAVALLLASESISALRAVKQKFGGPAFFHVADDVNDVKHQLQEAIMFKDCALAAEQVAGSPPHALAANGALLPRAAGKPSTAKAFGRRHRRKRLVAARNVATLAPDVEVAN